MKYKFRLHLTCEEIAGISRDAKYIFLENLLFAFCCIFVCIQAFEFIMIPRYCKPTLSCWKCQAYCDGSYYFVSGKKYTPCAISMIWISTSLKMSSFLNISYIGTIIENIPNWTQYSPPLMWPSFKLVLNTLMEYRILNSKIFFSFKQVKLHIPYPLVYKHSAYIQKSAAIWAPSLF